jgi:hypothetical protein
MTATFFIIIVYPLFSVLADDNDQQLAFADQTTMIKDQLNSNHNSSSTNGTSNSTIKLLRR